MSNRGWIVIVGMVITSSMSALGQESGSGSVGAPSFQSLLEMGGGIGGGNGGDNIVMDFRGIADQIAIEIEKNGELLPETVDSLRFREKVTTMQVHSTSQPLIIDGVAKDAMNFPAENTIFIQRDRWMLEQDLRKRWGIVSHEIFGLMGVDDSNYHLSLQISHHALSLDRLRPEVSFIRELYSQGRVPEARDLVFEDARVGWACTNYIALLGGREKPVRTSHRFKSFGGMLNDRIGFQNHPTIQATFVRSTLRMEGDIRLQHDSGRLRIDHRATLRIAPNGWLIVEYSTSKDFVRRHVGAEMVYSLAYSELGAYFYDYCYPARW